MARRLTWILAPEGGSDSDFLLPLIRRLLEELCVRSDHEVEIPDGIDLRNVDGYARGITSVIDVLGQNPGPTLVFVHADADGDADKARQRFVEPIVRSLALGREGVAVVPIRTIEAWVLADLRSLASVLGATERHLLDSGAPRASTEIEGHSDPKQLLNSRSVHRAGSSVFHAMIV